MPQKTIPDIQLPPERPENPPDTLRMGGQGPLSNAAPLTYLYLDDSGSRKPDRGKGEMSPPFDYFAIGGYMLDAEQDGSVKDAVDTFLEHWNISGPLHSVLIRNKRKHFAWLGQADEATYCRFQDELSLLLLSAPLTVIGCVVDRNGYNDRYRSRYGERRWHLCRTAFTIVVERAARQALARGRRLKVICEMSGRAEDNDIKAYYREIRTSGMPFDAANSAKYRPLSTADLQSVLVDLDFKDKRSRGLQLADLVVYPIARAAYEPGYRPYDAMRQAGLLLDCRLLPDEVPTMGIKYSCFPQQPASAAVEEQATQPL